MLLRILPSNELPTVQNNILTVDFDGFPTLISPLVGLAAFIIVSMMTGKNKATLEYANPKTREAQLYRR